MIKTRFFVPFIAFALAACGGIPSTSAIHQGQDVSTDTSQFIRVIARPPVANMSPEEIVRGFLDACADSTSTFATAREYLTSTASTGWNADTGVQIYDGTNVNFATGSGTVTLTAPLDSTVDTSGHLSFNNQDSTLSASFQLEQDAAQQWRISGLANGLLLARSDFERSFRPYPIYFMNQDSSALVPDSIVLPASGAGTATSVTRALLSGPSQDIASASFSAFPPGTKLSYNSVPVNSGIAQVDLSAEVLAASKAERSELSAQLVATLTTLPSVSAVRITVSGQPLVVPGVQGIQTPTNWSQYPMRIDPATTVTYVVRNTRIVRVASDGSVKSVASISRNLGSPLQSANASFNGTQFAGVTVDGKSLVLSQPSTSRMTVVATGDSLSRPTWDRQGNVLVADNGQGVVAVSAAGAPVSVTVDPTSLGDQKSIHQIAVAADGTRIAVDFRTGSVDTLGVGILLHSNSGLQISQLHRVERSVETINDFVWASPTAFEILGGQTSTYDELLQVDIADGQIVSQSAPVGANSIGVDAFGGLLAGISSGSNETVVRQSTGPWENVTLGRSPFAGHNIP